MIIRSSYCFCVLLLMAVSFLSCDKDNMEVSEASEFYQNLTRFDSLGFNDTIAYNQIDYTCEDHGVLISTGIDSNLNGVLDTAEIIESYAVCEDVSEFGEAQEDFYVDSVYRADVQGVLVVNISPQGYYEYDVGSPSAIIRVGDSEVVVGAKVAEVELRGAMTTVVPKGKYWKVQKLVQYELDARIQFFPLE